MRDEIQSIIDNWKYADRYLAMPIRFQIYENPRYPYELAASILGIDSRLFINWTKMWGRPDSEFPSLYAEYDWRDLEASWFDLLLGQFIIDTTSVGQASTQISLVKRLGEFFGEPYTVLTKKFWLPENREAIYTIQERLQIPAKMTLVKKSFDDLTLTDGASIFYRRLHFNEDGFVDKMNVIPKIEGKTASIDMKIDKSGGMPIMRNINIELLFAHYEIGGMATVLDFYDEIGFTEQDIELVVQFSSAYKMAA